MAIIVIQAKLNRHPYHLAMLDEEDVIRFSTQEEADIADEAERSQRGDIVGVFPDGTLLGKRVSKAEWEAAVDKVKYPVGEFPGTFAVIRVTDLTIEKARQLSEKLINQGTGDSILAQTWRAVWSDVPAGVKQKLRNDGEITVTISKIKNYIRRKQDEIKLDAI